MNIHISTQIAAVRKKLGPREATGLRLTSFSRNTWSDRHDSLGEDREITGALYSL